MNLIRTPKKLSKITEYLKEFEDKDLGKTKLCLGLELENKVNGIFVHQSAYTKKVLKHFNMEVRSLEPKKDSLMLLGL